MAAAQIRVRRATPADTPDIVRIHFAAFEISPMDRLLYPGGKTDEVREGFAKQFAPPATPPPAHEGEVVTMVAELLTAQDGGGEKAQVIAFAKWIIYRVERTEEQWLMEPPPSSEEKRGNGVDYGVFDAFIGDLERMRRSWTKGDRCMVLNILATDPAYQRRGAGAALVAWGLAIADKDKVPVWLESSPNGWPLYQRLGFEVVDTQDLDIGGRYNATQKDGEDWGANLAVDKLGPLAPGHFRTAMAVRRPVADA